MKYTIDNDKLKEVVEIFNETTDSAAPLESVKTEICGSFWNKDHDHQEWIDNTTPDEIATWLISFYVYESAAGRLVTGRRYDDRILRHA